MPRMNDDDLGLDPVTKADDRRRHTDEPLSDPRLREAFHSLGDPSRRAAPSFPSVWTSARERAGRTRPMFTLRRTVWVGTTLIVLGLVIVLKLEHSTLPSDQEALVMAQSLATWTAPSDELLASSDSLPSGLPTLSIQSIELPTGGHLVRSTSSQALEIEQ